MDLMYVHIVNNFISKKMRNWTKYKETKVYLFTL